MCATVLSLLLVVLVVTATPMIATPVRRPRGMLRRYVLRVTPIGTNIDDVIDIIQEREDWSLGSVDFHMGFSPITAIPRPDVVPNIPIVGEMSVSAVLGRYHAWYVVFGIPEVTATARWGFDEDGNLIDVLVLTHWSP